MPARSVVASILLPLERPALPVQALAPCFTVAAAAVRHIMADPLLPDALLEDHWPGHGLRGRYDTYERAYRHLLGVWLR